MKLTPERIREAIIASDYHYARAAKLIGCSPDTLRAKVCVLRREGHWFPGSRAIGRHNTPYDPTPEEIAAACAGFQSGWSDRERYSRRVVKNEPWQAPVVEAPGEPREEVW